MYKVSFGSKINLSVKRDNGHIDHYGDFHNHPMNSFFTAGHVRGSSTSSLNFASSDLEAITELEGTWSQSGDTVSRVTGSATLPASSSIYVFEDGTKAGWRFTGSGTSITVSKSNTVSAQKLFLLRTSTDTGNDKQTLPSVSSTRNYSDGEVSISGSGIFAPSSTSYTLRSIRQSQAGATNGNGVLIDIYPGIPIGVGDAIIINSYEYRFRYPTGEPQEFSVSPISGLSGSGRTQRLSRISVMDSANNPNRIYLLSSSNAIFIPDMYGPTGGTLINPSSLTIDETITATGSILSPSLSNDMTDSHSCFGLVDTGGTIKQISWGTTTELFGIIEYDTPVMIEAGKVLTVGMSTRFDPVITLPS